MLARLVQVFQKKKDKYFIWSLVLDSEIYEKQQS